MSRRFDIAPGGYILLAVLLLILPFPWLAASLAAAAVHELFHWCAIRLLGGTVFKARVNLGGMVMAVTPLPPGRELLCALAGPAGSLMLTAFLPVFPRLALCGLAQGVFNLLPLYPFDGGRILRCAMALLITEPAADQVCRWIEGLFLILLTAAGFALHWGLLSLIPPLSLWIRAKIPCKTASVRIQ